MSVLLDLVRGLAAFAVLIGHAGQNGLLGSWPLDDTFQHSAVVVFFVLSGLMIQQSVARDGMTLGSFVQARAARILPVTLFSVAFSVGVFGLLTLLVPLRAIPGDNLEVSSATVFMPLLFLSERFGGTEPVLNPPYWSLCYEVWFYTLYGIWTFMRGGPRRIAIALTLVAADLPVLLLLPIWLLGTWVGSRGTEANVRNPRLLLLVALAGFIISSWTHAQYRLLVLAGALGFDLTRLRFSSYFVTDTVAGVWIALAFVSLKQGATDLNGWAGFARWIAGFSFTLYLTHWPLLIAIRVLLRPDHPSLSTILALALPVTLAALLAPVLERKWPHTLRELRLRRAFGEALT